MPGEDRTGPLGQGPLTGRGLGPCGRGLRRRRAITKEEEKEILKKEKAEIEKRLKELK